MSEKKFINPYMLFYGLLIPNWLAVREEVSIGAKIVYGRLIQYARTNGEAFPRQCELAKEVALSDRQVRTYLTELEGLGLLTSEQRGLKKSNVYRFPWHEWMELGVERQHPAAPDRRDTATPDRKDSAAPLVSSNKEEITIKKDISTTTLPASRAGEGSKVKKPKTEKTVNPIQQEATELFFASYLEAFGYHPAWNGRHGKTIKTICDELSNDLQLVASTIKAAFAEGRSDKFRKSALKEGPHGVIANRHRPTPSTTHQPPPAKTGPLDKVKDPYAVNKY